MWLVLDCNVLVDASGQGIPEYAGASYNLLQALARRQDFVLAIDSKGKIKREYDNRINVTMYAHHWLSLLLPDRIKHVKPVQLPKGAGVALREAHLHRRDFPLVEAAWGSGKVIVTRDFSSFSDSVNTILRRRLGVRVLSGVQVLKEITGVD